MFKIKFLSFFPFYALAFIFLKIFHPMRVNSMRVCLMVVLLALGTSQAKAQFDQWPGAVQNIELGYGWATSSADYIRHDRIVREDGKVYDTTFSNSVHSKSGFSAILGTSLPLRRLGRVSSLNLGVDAVYNNFTWDYQYPIGINTTDSGLVYRYHDDSTFKGKTMNAGLAVSLDFKFGVDAMRDKNYRWGWTGGVGLFSSVNKTSDAGNDDMTYGFQPFVKTEVALRAGMVWKLRMMYAFGNVDYYKTNGNLFGNSNSTSEVTLQGKGTFSVSLLIMPFSFTYARSAWYSER